MKDELTRHIEELVRALRTYAPDALLMIRADGNCALRSSLHGVLHLPPEGVALNLDDAITAAAADTDIKKREVHAIDPFDVLADFRRSREADIAASEETRRGLRESNGDSVS